MAAATPGNAAGLAAPGCLAGGEAAIVTAVDDTLDLRLSDGRTVHLPGVALSGASEQTRALLQGWLMRQPVQVRPIRSGEDRWGRTDALVFASAADGAPAVSVLEALLDAGRALARPDPDLDACWPNALAAEREAQRAKRGLWAAALVVDPADEPALAAHEGGMALVAGRVGAVHAGRARLYLRFAQDGGTGMAAAVALPLAKRMAKSGQDPSQWTGRRLRVRGLLDRRWGWQIEVTSAQQLELDPP